MISLLQNVLKSVFTVNEIIMKMDQYLAL